MRTSPEKHGKTLSPREHSDLVRDAFEAKVTLLEAWGDKGPPDGAYIPRNHSALRRWRGPDGSLGTWTDASIDRSKTGKYPKLAEKFEEAIENIDVWLANKGGELGRLKAKIAVLEVENSRLVLQNAQLISRIAQLEEGKRNSTALSTARRKSSQGYSTN